jgi:hypothetical protein
VPLIFQPPVSEVLREPTRGALRRKILNAGALIDNGDAELGLDRVQDAADSIGMYLGGNVERLEALDVLKGSLDENGLPTEPRKPTACGEKLFPVERLGQELHSPP